MKKGHPHFPFLADGQLYVLPDNQIYRLVSIKSLLGPNSHTKGFRLLEADCLETWQPFEEPRGSRRSRKTTTPMAISRSSSHSNALIDVPETKKKFQRDQSCAGRRERKKDQLIVTPKSNHQKAPANNKPSKNHDLKKFSTLCLQLAEASLAEWRKRS